MKEKTTPFLKQLFHVDAIRKQYLIDEHPPLENTAYNDPLMEDSHEVVQGLIHKYNNRALIKVSYQCAAHCRFCTRIRQIGNKSGTLLQEDIAAIANYLNKHPEVEDVILSGGDPFYTPALTLNVLESIKNIASIKVVRIGTRLPFHAPSAFNSPVYEPLYNQIKAIAEQKPFYILIHIEHPDELVTESIEAVKKLKKLGATILSQTVLLRGINDDVDILEALFKQLYHLGVMPYYLYRCDNVKGLEHFVADKNKEKEIAQELRKRLSGIATPLLVEDIENGYGKIPI